MIAHIKVRSARTRQIIDEAKTTFVRSADLIGLAFESLYPTCEVEVTFQKA